MGWVVNLGDKSVDLDDLSPDTFDRLAAQETDVSWWAVYATPGGNSARLYRVICEAAKLAGVDPPGEPETMRDAKALLETLEVGPDLAEQPTVGDFPPMPATPESGSTSGAPGDSTGPETKPEPIPSASS